MAAMGVAPNAYDLVPYPSGVTAQTHPDRLGAVAGLHGLPCAPAETAQVLEAGCGDGANLIGMAVAYPQARFTGFDRAASAITRGRAVIDRLGLRNVRLLNLDILDAAGSLGTYDYVIAHGVYAWAPRQVRDALMALIGRTLAPAGVAYVSYNALPGGHVRRMVRDMLLAGLRNVTEPRARIARARLILRSIAEAPDSEDPGRRVMQAHCRRLLDRAPEILFHDDLGEVFEPAYLETFAAHAKAHGLQFLNEAGFELAFDGFLAEGQQGGTEQVVLAAQAGDFADVQSYRQSLLVRAEARPGRTLQPAAIRRLYASHRMRAEPSAKHSALPGVDPILNQACDRLLEARPCRLRVGELLADDRHGLALFGLCADGVLQLHAGPEPFRVDAGERPCASPLARLQIEAGETAVATLAHANLALPDEAERAFIVLLDGSRSRADLARAAEALFKDGTSIDRRLERLGRLALFAR